MGALGARGEPASRRFPYPGILAGILGGRRSTGGRLAGALIGALAILGLVPAASSEEPWRELATQDGVTVEVRSGPGEAMTVRGRGSLDHPLAAVRAVLLDLARFPTWIPSLAEWRVLERREDGALVYGRHELPWPLSDRDYTVRYSWRGDAREFALEARSAAGEGPEPRPGVVRLGQVHSIWAVRETAPGRSDVSYTYNGDLGGLLPGVLRRAAWKREAPGLFRALEQEVRRRGP